MNSDWKDLTKEIDLSWLSDKEVEEIVNIILAPNDIAPEKLYFNYRKIIGDENQGVKILFGAEKDKSIPSMVYFQHPGRFAGVFPLWFYAAYSDVMMWFHKKQKQFLREYNKNESKLMQATMKLFGIDACRPDC